MASEFEVIQRYFRSLGAARDDVLLGVGDDAALLRVPDAATLVLTTDALVEGVHFLPGAPAESLGHRALAVNLSDIAAMGATPAWMLLSLVMPQAEDAWLQGFCRGLSALALHHNVALVGGNLSRGPLSITVELAGSVPHGQALRRDAGRPGDDLYVSGSVGDAGAGRELLQGRGLAGRPAAQAALQRRFTHPEPRVLLGQRLRGLASACIDVSDGLYEDAGRLLQACRCAAELDAHSLPLSAPLLECAGTAAVQFALTGGEDYELCFTAPPSQAAAIQRLAGELVVPLSRIGRLASGSGLKVKSAAAASITPDSTFDHFRH